MSQNLVTTRTHLEFVYWQARVCRTQQFYVNVADLKSTANQIKHTKKREKINFVCNHSLIIKFYFDKRLKYGVGRA